MIAMTSPQSIQKIDYFLVSDHSADCPSGFRKKHSLHLARNDVIFNDTTFPVDQISMEQIFQKINSEGIFPKTTAPPMEEFLSIYEKIFTLNPNAHVLSLHPPPSLSATLKTAEKAREHLTPDLSERIHVINTHQGSVGLGLLLQETLYYMMQLPTGEALEPWKITAIIESWGKSIALIGTMKNLDYLLKGGRIGRAKWIVASLLHYQPLFQLQDDMVTPLGRLRERAKALNVLISHATQHVQPNLEPPFNSIVVGHVLAEEEALLVAQELKMQLPSMNVEIAPMGTLVGIHTGPGTIALAFHTKEPMMP